MHRGVRWNARTVCLSCLRTRCVDRAPLAASRQRPPDTRTGRSEVVTDTLTRSRISAATQISSFFIFRHWLILQCRNLIPRIRDAVAPCRHGASVLHFPPPPGIAAPRRRVGRVPRCCAPPSPRGAVALCRGAAVPPRLRAVPPRCCRDAVAPCLHGASVLRVPPPASMLRVPRRRCTFCARSNIKPWGSARGSSAAAPRRRGPTRRRGGVAQRRGATAPGYRGPAEARRRRGTVPPRGRRAAPPRRRRDAVAPCRRGAPVLHAPRRRGAAAPRRRGHDSGPVQLPLSYHTVTTQLPLQLPHSYHLQTTMNSDFG